VLESERPQRYLIDATDTKSLEFQPIRDTTISPKAQIVNLSELVPHPFLQN